MPRRRRFGRWITVLLAAVVALAAPVPALTPAAEAAEPRTAPTVPAAYLTQNIAWTDCPEDLDSRCARVRVPRDWTNPTFGTNDIWIAIAYLRASGTSKGLLTTNPGGPGVEGRSLTEVLATPTEFGGGGKSELRQFDLLGFDPRGFGASTRVRCLATQARLNKLPVVADRRVRNRATHAMEVAEAKLFGEACSAAPRPGGVSARYINTQQTVWDLDFLRALLDVKNADRSYEKLNYIGYSYGTWLGTWYADTYPTRVGKFVLDSNMQWTASMYVNQQLDSKSFQRRRDKMLFPYLARHHDEFGLGKSASKVKKTYESTRKKLAKQAKKDVARKKTPLLGPEDLDYIVASLIYANASFPTAGYFIDAAAEYAKKPSAGSRRTLAKRVKPRLSKAPFVVQRIAHKVTGSALVEIDGLAGQIVRCNDSAYPGNLRQMLKRADSDAKRYPFTGYLNTVPLCSYWKYKPQTRTIDFKVKGKVALPNKMLMLQSEGDPATSYEGARDAHKKIPAATVLVSVDNEGQHGLYIDGPSTCLERIGDAFLFSNRLPARNVRCTTSPLPYDRKVYALSGPVSGASSNAKKAVKAKNKRLTTVRADVAKRGIS